jgi:hypothetical protein
VHPLCMPSTWGPNFNTMKDKLNPPKAHSRAFIKHDKEHPPRTMTRDNSPPHIGLKHKDRVMFQEKVFSIDMHNEGNIILKVI